MATAAAVPLRRRLLIGLPITLGAAQLVAGGVDLLLAAALDTSSRATVTAYGVITGVAALVALVAYPIGGLVLDRRAGGGRSRSAGVIVGGLASVCGLVGFSQADEPATLAVFYVVAYASLPLVFVAVYAAIADRIPARQRGAAGAAVGAATILGGIAGNVLAARFATSSSTGAIVFGAILVGGIVAFVALDATSSVEAEGVSQRVADAVVARARRDLGWFAIGRFALFLAYAGVAGLAYFIWRDHLGAEQPAEGVAAFAIASGGATLVGSVVTGGWSDRLALRRPFVVASGLLVGAGVVAVAAIPTPIVFLGAGAVIGLGFGIYLAVGTAVATLLLPVEQTIGRDVGLIGATNAAAQVVAPIAGSAVAASFGYGPMLALAACASVASAFAATRIRSVA